MDFSWLQSGEFYSTVCAMIWAVAVVLFRKTGDFMQPVVLNLFKGTVGLVLFLLSMLILGKSFFPVENSMTDWWVLLISGAIGIGIADSLFLAALNRLGAGRQAIVDCLYSPFVIICSIIYLTEPLTPWLFAGMGLMGTAIMVGTYAPAKKASDLDRKVLIWGVLFGILSLLLMAVGIVMAKPILDRSDAWWVATVRLGGGWALLMVQVFLKRDQRRSFLKELMPSKRWIISMPAALLGTYLALIFWILGMKHTFTTIASVLNQSSSIFILILATVILKEQLTWRKMVAIVMGFGGGILATF